MMSSTAVQAKIIIKGMARFRALLVMGIVSTRLVNEAQL
jgi:hypothetical protein